MCGIAGLRHLDGSPVDRQRLTAMIDSLEHRGPDGRGMWVDGGIGFGHTRLSIIDLQGSAQPMTTRDERLHLTFNGEIFNYREARASLAYPFRTSGDTEVLLAALAEGGPYGVNRLRGQFACAVHDRGSDEVWLIRDRVGVLPLYYVVADGILAFASEIKALLAALPTAPALDQTQLASYLMRRAVPAPNTLLRGVRKVPPGHVVRVSADGRIRTEPYWTLPEPSDVLNAPDAEVIDLVDRGIRDAVADALVADVPVGSYLSGGIDSSVVVAAASRHVPRGSLQTFCAEFGDPRFDESAYAQLVSDSFATNHHRVPVRAEEFVGLWPRLSRFRDAPLSEPADIAVYCLAKAARDHVKVVLSGEGGDELFGGYPKYAYARATGRSGLVPAGLRRGVLVPAERALPASANRIRIALRAQTGASMAERLATWFAPFTAYECRELLGVEGRTPDREPAHRDAIDLMSRVDLAAWLPDNLLERGDRMSMAASLELRPPFLDVRLVELAFRLPSRYKVRRGRRKWVLSQVAGRYLPAAIVDRPKVGFRVPLDAWFRSGLKDMAHDLLLGSDSVIGDVLDMRAVARLVDDHERGRRNEEIRIWTLLSFEVWARHYLHSASAPAPA
jgi:asparagine synthase (glutamine-hydrolysing)